MTAAKRVLVVGGGPAGLMAAERLAGTGLAVTVAERMPSLSRKLLMAGRGGLNLTHSEAFERFVARYGPAAVWLGPMLEAFPPEAAMAWSAGLGQPTIVGSSGRVFPEALKASPLLRAWLARLESLGVNLKTRTRWTGWDARGRPLLDAGAGPEPFAADAVVLALGGASWPRLGSDGAWTELVAREGIAVTPLEPSNAAVRIAWSDIFRERFHGLPLKRIAVGHAGRSIRGEAVVTRGGLEGGALYALGPGLRAALAREGRAVIEIDLRPDIPLDELAARIGEARRGESTANILRKRAVLAPVAANLVREAGPLPAAPAALAHRIKEMPLTVDGLAGFERAISTAGGVASAALDGRLMLKARPGVFVAGEMLDWDAPTGGYLLQGCLASAAWAAGGVLDYLSRPTSERKPEP